jgi:DNA-binding response OmpR family regulator
MANILILEDYVPLARLMTDFLHSRGHRITTAESAQEGLEKILLYPPDLVLVDLALGTEDGLDVIRRAKAAGSKAKFLVVTGSNAVQHVVDAMRCGAEDYCTKPFKLEALHSAVQESLNEKVSGTLPQNLESLFTTSLSHEQSVLLHPAPRKEVKTAKAAERKWMRCTGGVPRPTPAPLDDQGELTHLQHLLHRIRKSYAY